MSTTRAKYVFKRYQDKAGEWRWSLRERIGRRRIIADSGEGFHNKSNLNRAINRLIDNIVKWEYEFED